VRKLCTGPDWPIGSRDAASCANPPPIRAAGRVPGRLFGPGCRSLFALWRRRAVLVEPRRGSPFGTNAAGGDSPSWLLRRVDVCRLDDSGADWRLNGDRWILSAGSASLRTTIGAFNRIGNGNDGGGLFCRSTLVDWLQLAWPALHPVAGRRCTDRDWLGGCRTQCLLACSPWLAAVWAVAVALGYGLVIGGGGKGLLRPDFFSATSCGQACLVSTNPMKAQQPPQPPQPTQQQPPKTDPIIDFASLESIANFSHLQSWAEQAWQMRPAGPSADKLIGQQQRRRRRWQRQVAPAQPFDDASALDSIQMVLEGVRAAAATGDSVAVYRGSQSALLFRICTCCAALALPDPLGSPCGALLPSWRRTLAGGLSVRRAEAVKCCETVRHQAVRDTTDSWWQSNLAGDQRELFRFASGETPANDSLNRPATQSWPTSASKSWPAPNRGIRWAVRLAGGCLLAATADALICARLLIEPNWFNNSWSADSFCVAFQREFSMLSSLAFGAATCLYTAGPVAKLFAGLVLQADSSTL
uniref:AMP-binding domain-containing protein n=1 Tax=Macrostomum lignano TaxID=282301 RepID=A0A1I8FDN1_9PLAT